MTAKEKKIIKTYLKAAYDNLIRVADYEAIDRAIRFPEGERFPTVSQEYIRAQSRYDSLCGLARALDIMTPCEDTRLDRAIIGREHSEY
jgi:hypothetical protein